MSYLENIRITEKELKDKKEKLKKLKSYRERLSRSRQGYWEIIFRFTQGIHILERQIAELEETWEQEQEPLNILSRG